MPIKLGTCVHTAVSSLNCSAATQLRHPSRLTPTVQALRLEPYLVISNQTGVPLQLMQPRGGAFQQSFAGVVPSRATRDGLPRVGAPPAGRSYTGQGSPPEGLRTAISAANADYTSTVDLPTGASTLTSECGFMLSGLRADAHCLQEAVTGLHAASAAALCSGAMYMRSAATGVCGTCCLQQRHAGTCLTF